MLTSAALVGEPVLETELEQLRTALQPLELPADTQVFTQGEVGSRMLLIADGQVRSSIRLPDGAEQTLSHAGPGDVVGEIALLTGARRSATVTTVTPLRGWTLDRHGFDVLRWDRRDAAIAMVQRLLVLTAARLRAGCTEIENPIADRGYASVRALRSIRRQVPAPGVDYLASLLCFAGFPRREDVDAAVRDVPVHSVERGEVLIAEGERPPALLLVVHGAVEVMVRRSDTSRRVRLAGPGRFVGHSGILDDEPSPVIARARERAVLLAFPRETITALLTDSAQLARAFSAALLEDTARAVREASRPVVPTTSWR